MWSFVYTENTKHDGGEPRIREFYINGDMTFGKQLKLSDWNPKSKCQG